MMIQPLEDYEFDSEAFSKNAIDLAHNSHTFDKQTLQQENDQLLQNIRDKLKLKDDPFKLVEEDLKGTKDFAITNIVFTTY